MELLKHVYQVDPTTKAVTTTQVAASLMDVINPSVSIVDPVGRLMRFAAYSFIATKIFER